MAGVSEVLRALDIRISISFLPYFYFSCLPSDLLSLFLTPAFLYFHLPHPPFSPCSLLPSSYSQSSQSPVTPTILSPALSYPSFSFTLPAPLYFPYTPHLLFPCSFSPSLFFLLPLSSPFLSLQLPTLTYPLLLTHLLPCTPLPHCHSFLSPGPLSDPPSSLLPCLLL